MNSIHSVFIKVRSSRLAAGLAAILAGLLFFFQSRIYIHQLPSTLDEGNYLYKGWLFATGVYWPYQAFGPWTNKMPLAFLIPGWVQALFEPGLRSGRYFAIVLGLLMLVGLWWLCRRFSGGWWAAAAVWVVAANPGQVKMIDQALSEGLVACLLVWAFAFTLGAKRPIWQTTLGAGLVSATAITRENMIPLVALLVIYIFWEQGRKAGLSALAVCVLVIGGAHAIFWPNILTIWTPWFPRKMTPFLDALRPYMEGTPIWDANLPFLSRVYSFWEGARFHFIALFGTVCTLILWPGRCAWKDAATFRASVTLAIAMIFMTLAHIYAALGKNYCVFCFPLYLVFFSPLGIALVAVSIPWWKRNLNAGRQAAAGLAALTFAVGIGFGAHQELADFLLTLQVPRIKGMMILPGSGDLWRLLANKFGASYDLLKQIVPTAAGALAGLLLLGLAFVIFLRYRKTQQPTTSFGFFLLTLTLLTGTLLSPTRIFGNPVEKDCGGDVIASYEQAGGHLASLIPPGSRVFWEGGLVTVPLLYLPGIEIYGPQLNDGYSFRSGGDSERLFRFGYWNEELSSRWLHEADFLLIEDRAYKAGYYRDIDPAEFEELEPTGPVFTCRDGNQIRTFRRIN